MRLKTILLLALPASGKSELRRYLASLSPQKVETDFHLGPTIQLDDFPYVHLMRQIDDVVAKQKNARLFFQAADRPFRDPRHWLALIELMNQDYRDLSTPKPTRPSSLVDMYVERILAAAHHVSAIAPLELLDGSVRRELQDVLARDCEIMWQDKCGLARPEEGTVLIEFARGGAEGASLPLAAPFGYQHSLAQLAPEILSNAGILYVWVEPEESRRKNQARTDPNDPGSILHHGVPETVMRQDYGLDDMAWLIDHAEKPGTVRVETPSGTFHVPVARFDNRIDKTSFLRAEPKDWPAADVTAVHEGLRRAFTDLARIAL